MLTFCPYITLGHVHEDINVQRNNVERKRISFRAYRTMQSVKSFSVILLVSRMYLPVQLRHHSGTDTIPTTLSM
jgi:hypothetical protein